MDNGDLLVLTAGDISTLLADREVEVIEQVRAAYVAHAVGATSLPYSSFLHFRGSDRNRIIALPAHLARPFDLAGMKWVSSFPDNLTSNLNRASAVIILNSASTGRPEAVLEGSIISAKRTAASAALAAQILHDPANATVLGVAGCGLINFEVVRFMLAAMASLRTLIVYDIDQSRAAEFLKKCGEEFDHLESSAVDSIVEVLRQAPLVSIATTATEPHIFDLSACPQGSTLLHISLRDLSPQLILSCENVVDDIDHVCRAQTSIHVAEQLVGARDFIRCSLPDILTGKTTARRDAGTVTVFSPFGLGILDIAVAGWLRGLARQAEMGLLVPGFLAERWTS